MLKLAHHINLESTNPELSICYWFFGEKMAFLMEMNSYDANFIFVYFDSKTKMYINDLSVESTETKNDN